MKKITVFLCFIYSTSISFAQDNDYDDTLRKMFDVSGSENSYKTVITQMVTLFKQQYPAVSEEIWNEFEDEFLSTSLDELVDKLVPVYRKYLTIQDLLEIIDFYQTPAGRKFAKNTPLIMQESMEIGKEWGMEIGRELDAKLKEMGY